MDSKLKATGLALTLIGFIPSVIWFVNFIQSQTTRSSDLFWGVPLIVIGNYLIRKSEDPE